jgi:hypothetical protein
MAFSRIVVLSLALQQVRGLVVARDLALAHFSGRA